MTSVPRTLPSPAPGSTARRRPPRTALVTGLVGLVSVGLTAGVASAAPAAMDVPLGAAESYAALAGRDFVNDGPTTMEGDLGAANSSTVGTEFVVQRPGDGIYTAGAVTTAVAALTNARDLAAGQGPGETLSDTNLAGQTLTPGVYSSGTTLSIAGPPSAPLTLNAEGNRDAVFVFVAGSSLVTQPSTVVTLIGGAQACNVYWAVGSDTTLGVGSTFRGTVLTLSDTTLNTGALLEGAVLSGRDLTLNANVITRPGCLTGTEPDPDPVVVPVPVVSTPTSPPSTPPTATPPTATPTPVAGPDGTRDRTAYRQVGRVPVGGVDTGDGSTS